MKKLLLLSLLELTFISGCAEEVTLNTNEYESQNENIQTSLYMVDIKGEIMRPGLYMVSSNSYIYEVIEIAGGLTANADLSNISLNECITDNLSINIPSKQSVASSITTNTKVNINTATLAELVTIKYIGNATASKIIAYRTDNGNFKTIEDIKNVSGISDGIFEKIKDSICVK